MAKHMLVMQELFKMLIIMVMKVQGMSVGWGARFLRSVRAHIMSEPNPCIIESTTILSEKLGGFVIHHCYSRMQIRSSHLTSILMLEPCGWEIFTFHYTSHWATRINPRSKICKAFVPQSLRAHWRPAASHILSSNFFAAFMHHSCESIHCHMGCGRVKQKRAEITIQILILLRYMALLSLPSAVRLR